MFFALIDSGMLIQKLKLEVSFASWCGNMKFDIQCVLKRVLIAVLDVPPTTKPLFFDMETS